MDAYHPSAKFHPGRADTLVVYCSDSRIQAAVQEFLASSLNLGGSYDVLAIPGGPQSLTLIEYLPKLSWALGKWLRFLVDAHELKRIVLIAHQDCGWYKQLPFHLFGSSDPRTRQEDDLRRARRSLAGDFPQVLMDLYYVTWDANNRVTIEAVAG
ncbi:MAG: hypothetical protein LAN62_03415 [Acidobacteriia bacterium]|nr:hypothetical protein [Terriglobia bacterium]